MPFSQDPCTCAGVCRALERLWPKPWESTAAGNGILTNIPEKSNGLSVDQSLETKLETPHCGQHRQSHIKCNQNCVLNPKLIKGFIRAGKSMSTSRNRQIPTSENLAKEVKNPSACGGAFWLPHVFAKEDVY